MKIRSVEANNRRRVFSLVTNKGPFDFPYAKLRLKPSTEDRVREVFSDPELGHEAFTYFLESGAEDTVHVDAVLEYNRDPQTMNDLLLYRLTVEAHDAIDRSGLSKREILRRLDTSAAQLYRLLDTTNYTKSVDQMLVLLRVLGKQVEVVVR